MLRARVLVVGAGPAGATAARMLAAAGVETLMVDRDLSYRKPCGGGISSLVFEEFALPPQAAAATIDLLRIMPPRGDPVTIRLRGGHLCVVERGPFDAVLRDLAIREGSRLMEGTFLRCVPEGPLWLSEIQTAPHGPLLHVRSDYIVAADGVSGRVARSLGIAKPPLLFTVSARVPKEILATPAEYDGDPCCEFWFGSTHASRFYSWVFPSSSSASIGTGAPSARGLSAMLDAFSVRCFGRSVASLAQDGLISRRVAFSIPQWRADAVFSRGNVLFAGDAAGTVLPVTHEGIYYAMKSGRFAAEAVASGRSDLCRALWHERFLRRFSLMTMISEIFYRGDDAAEKWVALHRKPEVQELSMRLWLRQDRGTDLLRDYLKIFRHLLKR